MTRTFLIGLIAASSWLASCTENPVSVREGASSECDNDGEGAVTPSGERVCVYRPSIVIETGFRCPFMLSNRLEFRNFSVCSGPERLPRLDIDFLHRRFDVPEGEPWFPERAPVRSLDIMWVIDNSGSFCQEQREIREGFRTFAEALVDEEIDFHVAVTTTQTRSDYAPEPLARPGHFQSRPQPVPGFDDSCIHALDDDGTPIPGDYAPVRETIALAVECMDEPAPGIYRFSDREIECALEGYPDCAFVNKECDGNCDVTDLFPTPEEYREIPKVLRAGDYRDASGHVDLERLRSDFACASLVGTRGYGIEKGLEAATLAISPELSGGTTDEPLSRSAPNHGFLRDDAHLAVLFASDENDCSHDGTLDEASACGASMCDYVASPEWPGPNPLIPVATQRRELLDALSASKGREVGAQEVIVGNFVGRSSPYTGPIPSEMLCASDHAAGSSPTCRSNQGTVYSGDRYDAFARSFPLANVFPEADFEAPDTPLDGLLCSGEPVSSAMPELGAFLARTAR